MGVEREREAVRQATCEGGREVDGKRAGENKERLEGRRDGSSGRRTMRCEEKSVTEIESISRERGEKVK